MKTIAVASAELMELRFWASPGCRVILAGWPVEGPHQTIPRRVGGRSGQTAMIYPPAAGRRSALVLNRQEISFVLSYIKIRTNSWVTKVHYCSRNDLATGAHRTNFYFQMKRKNNLPKVNLKPYQIRYVHYLHISITFN